MAVDVILFILKLARFLRRWQLGVACLDTSRLGYASPKTSHA